MYPIRLPTSVVLFREDSSKSHTSLPSGAPLASLTKALRIKLANMYKLLANIVVIIHIAFVIWVILGGFVARRNKFSAVIQLSCLLYGISITLYGFQCPLTDIEKHFLSLAGENVYEGEFLPHYLWSQFKIGQSSALAIAILVLLISVNIAAYLPIIKNGMLRHQSDKNR